MAGSGKSLPRSDNNPAIAGERRDARPVYSLVPCTHGAIRMQRAFADFYGSFLIIERISWIRLVQSPQSWNIDHLKQHGMPDNAA